MKDKFLIVYKRLEVLRLDENVLCRDFWSKIQSLKNNFNEKYCWDLMTNHIEWLLNCRATFDLDFDVLTTQELKEWFSEEELNINGIYTKGTNEVTKGLFIALGDARLKVSGHSEVILFDNAFADCFDTTFCKAHGNSYFIVNDCIGSAFGNSNGQAVRASIIENYTDNEMKKGKNCIVVNR